MASDILFPVTLLVGAFPVGLLLSLRTKWRVWVAAVVTSVIVVVVGAIVDPITFELGNAIAAFLPALAGAVLGSYIQRKRIS